MTSVLSVVFLSFVFYFIFYGSKNTDAQWSWMADQRSHDLTPMDDASMMQLCAMTNIADIKDLLQPILVPRIVDSPQHRKVGEYLKSTVEKYGFHTEWDEFVDNTPHGKKTFRNLIATFDPSANRRLTLACHYDSKIMPGFEFIGATDSALPCALLLDIAKTLGPLLKLREKKDIALQLLFLDGEEAFVNWTPTDSIYGARHLVSQWEKKLYPDANAESSSFSIARELDRLDVFVLLDLLGAKNPTISNYNGLNAENLYPEFPRIESALRRLKCLEPIRPIFRDELRYAFIEDDHVPFLRKGVRVLHLISAPFPKVWHTVEDNADALDDQTVANLASILRVFVVRYLGIRI